ncbi:MAG: hypothetical protein R3D05_15715 [Dongiaceae bacterium]
MNISTKRQIAIAALLASAAIAAPCLAQRASAQDDSQLKLDPEMMCGGAAAAYQSYAQGSTDPDIEDANDRVKEAIRDCHNKDYDQGIRKINEATALIHDHVKTRR